MDCSYCNRETPIIKEFSSEKCNAICQACTDRVEMWETNRLLECPAGGDFLAYIQAVFQAACAFINRKSLATLTPDIQERLRKTLDTENRFKSLQDTTAEDWMPVLIQKAPEGFNGTFLEYGRRPHYSPWYYDGVHRACLACVHGEKVPVYVPSPEYVSIRERQYQTLVLPNSIERGERDCDRWQLFPKESIQGKTILELGCNSAMDGIMNCVLSSQSVYLGCDKDGDAIRDGNAVAKLWGVDDRVTLIECDVDGIDFPKDSVLFFLSVSNVIRYETFRRALEQSGARTIFLETHNQHDDPNSWKILECNDIEWSELGRTSHTCGGPLIRSLYRGNKI